MSRMRLGGVRVGSIVSARPPQTSSGLRPTADIRHQGRHFRKVPEAEMQTARGKLTLSPPPNDQNEIPI
jgi:hypothetical protein